MSAYTIPLAKPYIPAKAMSCIAEVLASGYLSEGTVTRKFEVAFADFVGTTYAIATTSCTTGIELLLRALDIGYGDEVIVPDYTYPATAQAVMIVGATAVIVDCDPMTLNVDYAALEKAITPRTRALLPVSLFGNPLDWGRLNQIAKKYSLPVIEDAACALGSSYQGRRTGALGLAAVFSLHPRKNLTTGEGGMITTSDDALAERLRSMKHFGCKPGETREDIRFVYLGTNLKMSDIVAAVGLAQMDNIDKVLARRQHLAQRYKELLKKVEDTGKLYWPTTPEGGLHAWQSCCICLKNRDFILNALRSVGIEAQIGTYALHREPLFTSHNYARLQGQLYGSMQAYESVLALPLYYEMEYEQQIQVAQRIVEECAD